MLRQVVCPYVRATPSLQGTQLYLLAKVIIFHQFSTFLCLLFEGQQVMIQEMEDAAARLSTLHGEELMQEAAVPKKIVEEDFFCGGTAALYNPIVE